jgi:hypothetical protein
VFQVEFPPVVPASVSSTEGARGGCMPRRGSSVAALYWLRQVRWGEGEGWGGSLHCKSKV